MSKPRVVRTDIQLTKTSIAVYAGKRFKDALADVLADMNLYKAAKFSLVMEVVYQQGMKNGARLVFDKMDAVKKEIIHRNPGQPKKKKK
jgi:hypothetical protein